MSEYYRAIRHPYKAYFLTTDQDQTLEIQPILAKRQAYDSLEEAKKNLNPDIHIGIVSVQITAIHYSREGVKRSQEQGKIQ